MSEPLIVMVTTPDEAQARHIARKLLENKLAAGVNMLPISSMYMWQGELRDHAEVLMIIQTNSAVFKDKLIAAVQAEHSYQVPEIIALPIVMGSTEFLRWIDEHVRE